MLEAVNAGSDLSRRCKQATETAATKTVAVDTEATGPLCAICFEVVDAGVDLPCRCKVDYCMQCWDKALAKSFNACANVRCPTCRSPVRVDFDPITGHPTFAAETENEDPETTRKRISKQMRPRQERILQEFGAAHPLACGKGDAQAAAAALAERLAEAQMAPRCVCGAALEKVSLEERVRRFVDQATAWRDSQRLAPLLRQGRMRVVCDLCDEPISRLHESVWVCERGDATIKHATSNDVCAKCFARHAWGVSQATMVQEASTIEAAQAAGKSAA